MTCLVMGMSPGSDAGESRVSVFLLLLQIRMRPSPHWATFTLRCCRKAARVANRTLDTRCACHLATPGSS